MKKTLLLAAALACSGVAQAEIYFCQVEQSGLVNSFKVQSDGFKHKYIISTSVGFKQTTRESYDGVCETYVDESAKSLVCTNIKPWFSEFLTLDLSNMLFNHITTSQGVGVLAAGSCTEVEL